MLQGFGLPEKQILLLVSNQVVQMCDEMFEFRQHASNVDMSNKVSTAARYMWVSLQALNKMDEYMRAKFRNHPGFTGTFIRFITRQVASLSVPDMDKKIKELDKKIKELEKKNSGGSGNYVKADRVDRLEQKLNLIIKVNQLKKSE